MLQIQRKICFKVTTFFNRSLKKRKRINTVSDEICFHSYKHNNNKQTKKTKKLKYKKTP